MVIKLAQTKEALVEQVDEILFEQDLPVDQNHRQLVAGMIFQTPPDSDEVDTDKIGAQVRGMLARRLLYFIMKPEAEEKAANETAKAPEVDPT